MATLVVPAGTVFGRWTVIEEAEHLGDKRAMLCICECGTEKVVRLGVLRQGRTTSCGCAQREGTKLVIPPGTVFGPLTVIEEARANGRRAMFCRCECGMTRTVTVTHLRSGHTKSCGCGPWGVRPAPASRGEIPLHGRKAAGRVAFVDDGDWDMLMQYRWHIKEDFGPDGRRVSGPYALTSIYLGNRRSVPLSMHQFLTGFAQTDHWDGNGLNNQRSNLRPATSGQNSANRRKRQRGCSSRFKGVSWYKRTGRWQAYAQINGRIKCLGYFDSEEEAARAYDAAVLEAWGEFARPNFPREPAA